MDWKDYQQQKKVSWKDIAWSALETVVLFLSIMAIGIMGVFFWY